MLQIVESPFVETFDVSNAGKKLQQFFLSSRELTGLTPYQRKVGAKHWLPESNYGSAETNYLLGKTAERFLPRETLLAIRNLSIGGFPRVILLKGMPTGTTDENKLEKGFPLCAMSLRAISALLVKRDDTWENASYAATFNLESNSGNHLQQMHCDYPLDSDDVLAYGYKKSNTKQVYSLLHYTHTDGKTPTWFAPYSLDDADKDPDESRHIPIVACSGDLLIFNNLRILHARGKCEGTRHFVGLNPEAPWSPLRVASSQMPVIERPRIAAAFG